MLNPREPLARQIRPFEGTFVPGWSVRRVWWLSLVLTCAAVLVVCLTSPRVDLIGLFVVGPCCALLTGQWRRTSLAATLTIGSAFAMPARFGGVTTSEHLPFPSCRRVGQCCLYRLYDSGQMLGRQEPAQLGAWESLFVFGHLVAAIKTKIK